MLSNQELDLHLLRLFPQEHIKAHIKSTKDLYLHRAVLKNSTQDEYTLGYLLKIVLYDIKINHRFQTLPCLMVIRRVIKKFPNNHQFCDEVTRDLFALFKHYFLHRNENVQACVNICIKGQILCDEEIQWLTENYHLSTHIVNRLLKYPIKNGYISTWAIKILNQKELLERISEVISILIESEVPSFIKATPDQIIWGIYYSKTSEKIKKKLIRERFCINSFEALLQVSERLNYLDISRELIEFVQKNLS